MIPFANQNEYLCAELRRLDTLLHREIARLRAAHLLAGDELRGLYVSDVEVDALLRQAQNEGGEPLPDAVALTAEAERLRAEIITRSSPNLPLPRLATLFGLEDFERDVLLMAVVPELELRYEVIYSYLNNDVTRKRPNCDLALRLLCNDQEERWQRRHHFTREAPLFRYGLLEWLPESADAPASSLARSFKAPLRVVDYLLGVSSFEAKLAPFTRALKPQHRWNDLLMPEEFLNGLRSASRLLDECRPTILILEGRRGSGKQACVEALCAEMGCGLLVVDVEPMLNGSMEIAEALKLIGREQRLIKAGVYMSGADALFDHDGRLSPKARGLARNLADWIAPVIFAGSEARDWKALLEEKPFHVLRCSELSYDLRKRTWERELSGAFGEGCQVDAHSLANQFVLTGGQIRDAVRAADEDLRLRDRTETVPSREQLFAAARTQSQHGLHALAQRIEPIYTWDNLVLPPGTMSQLREITSAVRHRHMVYSQWGFDQRLALGKGLKAIFAGPSGTGKTMTADVLARELGVDLYKIDLSTVVSKYIGETEKNLDRIFRAAQCSNAILFFDEADALFGKRSPVKDAHDRNANIEVAYLLQKVEEYEGFVILATNLGLNIDDAFKRRMNYAVEFPFPDETHRELLWRSMFPPQTPLSDDLDFGFLGRQFALSGGNIKNAALAAAFLAAADGRVVQMRHLIQAVAREWQKLGKLPSAEDFKQYYTLLQPATPTKGAPAR